MKSRKKKSLWKEDAINFEIETKQIIEIQEVEEEIEEKEQAIDNEEFVDEESQYY